MPLHYYHHFLSEETHAHTHACTCLVQLAGTTLLRLLIGTRPELSRTCLQLTQLIPYHCSYASITGKTLQHAKPHTDHQKELQWVYCHMLPENCRHDEECFVENNVRGIQRDHNKYLHHWLLNVFQIWCVWRWREKEGELIMTRILL